MASLNLIMIAIVNPGKNKIKCTLANMMRTAELDMADSVSPNDIADFLNDTAFAVRSTYHLVLKASPGAGILVGNPSLLTGKRLEITGNARLILVIQNVRTKHESIAIIKDSTWN
eukprot:scaffold7100_cov65-Cyclotella_meneghiniana.AAC.2